MNSIQTAYINALLADAAYIENIGTGEINASRFAPRLTPTQATYLAANFTVVTSLETPNTIDPQLGTGFDAVVWQIKVGSELAGPNNVNAGKIFVSMRGTQGGTDIADDGTLASRGIPYDQIRDMVNGWLKNTAAVTNTQVQQIKVIEAPGLIGAKTFALDTPTTGTGLLNELDGIAGVNGHSLGGYLSTAFTRIFGAAWGVEQVSTFNSAGFSGVAGLNRGPVGDGGRLFTGVPWSPEAIAKNDHPTLGRCLFRQKFGAQAACGTSAKPQRGRPHPRTDRTPQSNSPARRFA